MNYVTSGWKLKKGTSVVWKVGITKLLWALSMIIVVWLILETGVMRSLPMEINFIIINMVGMLMEMWNIEVN